MFFNQNGQRASLTGERESEVPVGNAGEVGSSVIADTAAGPVNQVLLIQIPMKQKTPMRFEAYDMYGMVYACEAMPTILSDVENAVIGHGELEGPFTEIDRLDIERDPRFPVRVTGYEGPKVQPEDWWENFWARHKANTRDSPQEAWRKLKKLLGAAYQDLPVDFAFL